MVPPSSDSYLAPLSSVSPPAMISLQSLSFALLTLIFVTTILWSIRRRRSTFPLPPGPRGYPIIGNMLDMPSLQDQAWSRFAKWGQLYGKVYIYWKLGCWTVHIAIGEISSVTVFSQTIVVLNSVKSANDMLAAKSSIYSDRPRKIISTSWHVRTIDFISWHN